LAKRKEIFRQTQEKYTLDSLYKEIHDLETQMRPLRIEQADYIKLAQKIWELLEDAAYPHKIE